MIEKLILEDFQKHKKFELTLDPNISVISGSSDRGKSSIFRAIRWVCLNRPTGDSFIRKGSKDCSVSLKADGKWVTRERGKGANLYNIGEKSFSAFGQDVPEEIANFLNVDEGNFQSQHASSFFFSDTAGEVSRQLNAIVNLSLIDSTLANLASELRQARSVVSVSESRLKAAEKQKEELAWVLEAERDWQEVEEKEQEWRDCSSRREELARILEQARKAKETLEDAAEIGELGRAAVEAGEKLIAVRRQRDELNSLMGYWDKCSTEILTRKQEAEGLEKELKEKSGGLCPICGGRMK